MQGTLHSHIMANIGSYLEPNTRLVEMLEMLRREKKQLFILTNRFCLGGSMLNSTMNLLSAFI